MWSQIILKYLNSTFPLPLTESALKHKCQTNTGMIVLTVSPARLRRCREYAEKLFLGKIKSSSRSY